MPGGTAGLGYLHCGPSGAGHFVKMVHNGIEYGLMAAYAEGLSILRHADAGMKASAADAETAPLRDPELYQYDFNLPDISEVWRRGSVISSWLLDLTAAALAKDPSLSGFEGRVSDSGEGRWTISAAIDEGVPRPCSPPHFSSVSARAGRLSSRTSCCRRCVTGSGGMLRRPAVRCLDADRSVRLPQQRRQGRRAHRSLGG